MEKNGRACVSGIMIVALLAAIAAIPTASAGAVNVKDDSGGDTPSCGGDWALTTSTAGVAPDDNGNGFVCIHYGEGSLKPPHKLPHF